MSMVVGRFTIFSNKRKERKEISSGFSYINTYVIFYFLLLLLLQNDP